MDANIASFNARNAVVEADSRANIDSFISNSEYLALSQSTNVEDFLTAVGSMLSIQLPAQITPSDLKHILINKFLREFTGIFIASEGRMYVFMMLLRLRYCLDNAIALVSASIRNKVLDKNMRLHPLGMFEGVESLMAMENFGDVLPNVIEVSPIGKYFLEAGVDLVGFAATAQQNLMELEILKTRVYRAYEADLARFSRAVGGNTWDCMNRVLSFNADRMTILLRVNLLGYEDVSPEMLMDLFPRAGEMYPGFQERIAQATDFDSIKMVAEEFQEYRSVFDMASNEADSVTLLDAFGYEEVKMLIDVMRTQFNFGAIYAYFKLKEIEIVNVMWLYECLLQKRFSEMRKYIEITN